MTTVPLTREAVTLLNGIVYVSCDPSHPVPYAAFWKDKSGEWQGYINRTLKGLQDFFRDHAVQYVWRQLQP